VQCSKLLRRIMEQSEPMADPASDTQSPENGDFQGYFVENLSVGMTATVTRIVMESDVEQFAAITGDTNPIHLDHDYALATLFKGRIVHGMLTASYISAVLGTKLPGPGAVYISQSLRFKAPVRLGDRVVAQATVMAVDAARRRVSITTICCVGETAVLEGEAVLMVPSQKAAKA